MVAAAAVVDADAVLAIIEPRVNEWPERASALVIVDDKTNEAAGELLLAIKSMRAEVADAFDPIISAAHKAHKAACDQKKKADAPLLTAEAEIKRRMAAYYDARERARREEQRRLEAEARAREEAERLEEAAALEAEGRNKEAEEVLATPAPTVMVAPPPPAPKVAGIAPREVWRARVTDKAALVAAVAAGKAPLALLEINQTALDGMARALKSEFVLPGCEPVRETTIAARGR
jgi:hypothetical protein